MIWALLILLIIVGLVHWFDYSREVQEYIFAQPKKVGNVIDVHSVISEKTPIIVDIGFLPWCPEIVEKSAWTVKIEDESTLPIKAWLDSRMPIDNTQLAEDIGLQDGLADIDDARAKWWLPGLHNVSVDILNGVLGLSWITAERQWIGCSSGALTVWLVHSRYRRYLPDNEDPWALTSENAPYISRVQYIEVKIAQGWCIGLPTHWGYALRNDGAEAWMWMAEQHSPMSYALAQI